MGHGHGCEGSKVEWVLLPMDPKARGHDGQKGALVTEDDSDLWTSGLQAQHTPAEPLCSSWPQLPDSDSDRSGALS